MKPLVVARRAEVAPQRHAERVVPVPGGAEGPAEAGVGPVGHHDVAGPHLVLVARRRGRAPWPRRSWGAPRRLGARPADVPGGGGVEDGSDGLGPLPHRGPRLGGPLGHQLVEVVAGDDVAHGRERRVVGPGHLHGHPVGARPQAVEAVRPGQGAREPHVGELADRARGEAVTAGLLPREVLLLDHHHVPAGVGQPVRAGRARGAAPDHHDVVDTGVVRPPRAGPPAVDAVGFGAGHQRRS